MASSVPYQTTDSAITLWLLFHSVTMLACLLRVIDFFSIVSTGSSTWFCRIPQCEVCNIISPCFLASAYKQFPIENTSNLTPFVTFVNMLSELELKYQMLKATLLLVTKSSCKMVKFIFYNDFSSIISLGSQNIIIINFSACQPALMTDMFSIIQDFSLITVKMVSFGIN